MDDSVVDSQKYKLVMIGRRITEEEHLLDSVTQGSQHVLSTDVFHESGEKFGKGVLKDEGMTMHYLRHIYLIVGMVAGVTIFIKTYQMSFQLQPLYEYYLDWVLFQHVKRGGSVELLGKVFYQTDRYSVEGRSS